jgi:hypothetical protein
MVRLGVILASLIVTIAASFGAGVRVESSHGVPTLTVSGVPLLVMGAQCDIWRSMRQDAATLAFFDGYRDLNATVVSVGVPWSRCEPEKGRYDFAFLDWFIEQAEARGLRLIVNLFNSNVCGKSFEASGYPQYTPSYLIDAPDIYTRMVLTGPSSYVEGGPPLCPNDPDTREREVRYVAEVARHMRRRDRQHTVVMVQLNNEYYYQQWTGERPADETSVRCQCPACAAAWPEQAWRNGEEFMFTSLADYAHALSKAFLREYRLPLYLNSPWWPPRVVGLFLERCPEIGLVGIDGVLTPNEPNMLSLSQVGRNLPFAAENPTENGEVRLNLDVLPYYTVLGRMGLGNLLWECGPPSTVVDDADARGRYGAALYPLKQAMVPLAQARGTERLAGWYALRAVAGGCSRDVFGNLMAPAGAPQVVVKETFFVREGTATRIAESSPFTLALAGLSFEIADSPAGFVIAKGRRQLLLGTARGDLRIAGGAELRVTEDSRRAGQPGWSVSAEGGSFRIRLSAPAVLSLRWE